MTPAPMTIHERLTEVVTLSHEICDGFFPMITDPSTDFPKSHAQIIELADRMIASELSDRELIFFYNTLMGVCAKKIQQGTEKC